VAVSGRFVEGRGIRTLEDVARIKAPTSRSFVISTHLKVLQGFAKRFGDRPENFEDISRFLQDVVPLASALNLEGLFNYLGFQKAKPVVGGDLLTDGAIALPLDDIWNSVSNKFAESFDIGVLARWGMQGANRNAALLENAVGRTESAPLEVDR
jgi:hypothetical protein